MLSGILNTESGTLSIGSALLCTAAAAVLGLLIMLVYSRAEKGCTKGFLMSLAMIPVLVMSVILMTGGSLGTAVAAAGTFSLIRFRSAPGTAKEMAAIFTSMAAGIACGAGQVLFALMMTGTALLIFIVLSLIHLGGDSPERRDLRITIPEDLDYTSVFDSIFSEYASSCELMKSKTAGMRSLYELTYEIRLKDVRKEKEMMDRIRERNGNLSVSCARHADSAASL